MTDIFAKASMGVLFAASVPIGGDTTLWAQWGLAGLVVGFTLWRDHYREKRMSLALERDHKWIRETLVDALKENSALLEKIAQKLDERSAA